MSKRYLESLSEDSSQADLDCCGRSGFAATTSCVPMRRSYSGAELASDWLPVW